MVSLKPGTNSNNNSLLMGQNGYLEFYFIGHGHSISTLVESDTPPPPPLTKISLAHVNILQALVLNQSCSVLS